MPLFGICIIYTFSQHAIQGSAMDPTESNHQLTHRYVQAAARLTGAVNLEYAGEIIGLATDISKQDSATALRRQQIIREY